MKQKIPSSVVWTAFKTFSNRRAYGSALSKYRSFNLEFESQSASEYGLKFIQTDLLAVWGPKMAN